MHYLSNGYLFLKDEKEFSDLEKFNSSDIKFEFQTILEEDVFQTIDYLEDNLIGDCEYFVQSGSFKSVRQQKAK